VGELKSSGKPFEISKREVWEAYERVKANKGAPGVDGCSIEEFEADLKNNLYKIWNRMSSGSYFPPPVRAVEVPKPHGGGVRVLGVPDPKDRLRPSHGQDASAVHSHTGRQTGHSRQDELAEQRNAQNPRHARLLLPPRRRRSLPPTPTSARPATTSSPAPNFTTRSATRSPTSRTCRPTASPKLGQRSRPPRLRRRLPHRSPARRNRGQPQRPWACPDREGRIKERLNKEIRRRVDVVGDGLRALRAQ
jgi:hypothetical protein